MTHTHTYLVAATTSQKPTCILEMDKKRIIKLLPWANDKGIAKTRKECKIQAIVQYHKRNLTRVDALSIRQLKNS